jgi:hypothetical protein
VLILIEERNIMNLGNYNSQIKNWRTIAAKYSNMENVEEKG